MHIVQIITNFFTLTDPQYSAAVVVKTGLIVLGFVLVYKYKPRWQYLAYAALLIFLLRGLLFGQYFSWGFYKDHLTVDDIGWRQQSAVTAEYYKFFKPTRKKYMAVGSSQTYAVYFDYSQKHNHLTVFSLAGMAPLDLYLYRIYILARDPEYILLYLSEFDLAKAPRLDASKSAPPQGLSLWQIVPTLFEASKSAHSETEFKEMIVGEFLPEYKYSFIFKGFIEKWMKKNEALRVKSLYEQLSPDAQELQKNARDMAGDIDERWIPYNTYFLAKFLAYCREHSLKVVILEGQYNPVAFNEKSAYLNRLTRKALEDLAQESAAVFVPRSNLPQFTQDDYNDVMHVKPAAGYRFVESLVNNLENNHTRNAF